MRSPEIALSSRELRSESQQKVILLLRHLFATLESGKFLFSAGYV